MAQLHPNNYDPGDTAYLLCSTLGVFFMIPGLGFLYSGLARRKSALSMIWLALMAGCTGMVVWWFWGFSLAFSPNATNGFIGDLHYIVMRNILDDPEDAKYPQLLWAVYQGMFCSVTCAIMIAGVAERGRFLPTILFLTLWSSIVYPVMACWAWGPNGFFGGQWGVLDFAGGGPVEIGSGVGGMALAFVVGRRREKLLLNFRPHNVSMVSLGTVVLWFGWLAFNGGSASGANLRAVYAIMNSNLTAAFGALAWSVVDWRLERKWSMVAVCSGIVSGLVAATPCSGVIPMWSSIVLGIVAGVACNMSTQIKYLINVDDSLDTFAEHGVAGIIGLVFNAFFGADWVVGLDGVTEHEGGWLSHNWKLMYKQLAYIGACTAWTTIMTIALAYGVGKIPGFHWRVDEKGEKNGVDEDQIGEFAYDYVEVRRDFFSWNPPPSMLQLHTTLTNDSTVLLARTPTQNVHGQENNPQHFKRLSEDLSATQSPAHSKAE